MVKVTYIEPNGTTRVVDAEPGSTVMENAVDNDIEGIVAECGGGCSCATCHVYVDEAWLEKLPAPEPQEDGMLDCVLDRQSNSRLSCQIEVTTALDGIVVTVPEEQI